MSTENSDGWLTEESLLPVGTRIRHRGHRDLTGTIKAIEYVRPRVVSGIPYCIEWDDDDRACDVIGWFFVYASDYSIEPIAEVQS